MHAWVVPLSIFYGIILVVIGLVATICQEMRQLHVGGTSNAFVAVSLKTTENIKVLHCWLFVRPSIRARTVYPKKYAHGFCFAVLCCGYTLTDFPISIRLTSLALWQSNDCPSASKATLMNMDKYFMWIYYERLHNHNKAKHNKTVCKFLGIYCIAEIVHAMTLQWEPWNFCTVNRVKNAHPSTPTHHQDNIHATSHTHTLNFVAYVHAHPWVGIRVCYARLNMRYLSTISSASNF